MIANEYGPIATSDAARARLGVYIDLLKRWQATINLVAPSTIPDLFNRHFADSLQLLPLAGAWSSWVDLGSGGGFPGLVIAVASDDDWRDIHLIESDKRKAAFLREVSRETGKPVTVHVGRIENIVPNLAAEIDIDIISARGLAPMRQLLAYAKPAIDKGATGLFLKGKAVTEELTAIAVDDSVQWQLFDSQTETDAKIVVVRRYNSQAKFV